METPFDQFAKDMWAACLERVTPVATQVAVAAEVQYVDLTFEGIAEVEKLAALQPFGMVARITAEGSGHIEFFHEAPSVEDVLFCMQKQIQRRRETQPPPRLWIISAGRPTKAIDSLGFAPDETWLRGVYRCLAQGFLLTLVAVSELPKRRDTLLLRLLGTGSVLKQALAEVRRLPDDAPELRVIRPAMLQLLANRPELAQTPEEEELLMTAEEFAAQWEQRAELRGEQRGELRGEQRGELRGLRRGRQETLLRGLKLRFGVVDASIEARVLEASADELDLWLDRVFTARNTEDVFNE